MGLRRIFSLLADQGHFGYGLVQIQSIAIIALAWIQTPAPRLNSPAECRRCSLG